jgi:hypothetical protein
MHFNLKIYILAECNIVNVMYYFRFFETFKFKISKVWNSASMEPPEFQMAAQGLRLVLTNCRHSPRSQNNSSMQLRFVQFCILVCFRSCSYVITERIRKKKVITERNSQECLGRRLGSSFCPHMAWPLASLFQQPVRGADSSKPEGRRTAR